MYKKQDGLEPDYFLSTRLNIRDVVITTRVSGSNVRQEKAAASGK